MDVEAIFLNHDKNNLLTVRRNIPAQFAPRDDNSSGERDGSAALSTSAKERRVRINETAALNISLADAPLATLTACSKL